MSPYIELSELSELTNRLVTTISKAGHEVRCIMPRYSLVNERRYKLHEVVRLSGINIPLKDEDYYLQIKVTAIPNYRVQVYFLESQEFFKRKFIDRDENDMWFDDNYLRSIFFCKGSLKVVKKFSWSPDVIFCNGWMASLIPLYLKTVFSKEPEFYNTKVAFSVPSPSFTELLDPNLIKKITQIDNIPKADLKALKTNDNFGLIKSGIQHADILAIQTPNLLPEFHKLITKSKKTIIPFDGWDSNFQHYLDIFNDLS